MKLRLEFLALLLVIVGVTAIAIPFNLYSYESSNHLAVNVGTVASSGSSLAAIADTASFNGALAWVKSAGYFFMFIAMVVEGPIITSAAAFAAALGYFNIFVIFAIAIAGDVVADYIYYTIGYVGRVKFVEKYGHHVGLTDRRLKHMERLIKQHPKKTLAAIKLAPFLPAPGLMMIGATRMPIRQYTIMTFLVAIPKTLIFILLGYYFGDAYDRFSGVFQNGEYFIIAALGITVIAFYAYSKLSASLSTRLETI